MSSHPKHRPSEERRSDTVQAVVELAAKGDPSEITTSAIAARMKLTQAALFKHFPTKNAIWEAVMTWVAGILMARVDKAAEESTSPLEALEAVFMTHIEFVAQHPGVPRILFGELQRSGKTPAKAMVQALIAGYAGRLRTLIDKGKAQGELSIEVDSGAAATLFIGMIQGLVMQSLISGDIRRILQDSPGAFAVFRRGIRKKMREGQP
jgi:TetR/AcrR family transcriptional regulator